MSTRLLCWLRWSVILPFATCAWVLRPAKRLGLAAIATRPNESVEYVIEGIYRGFKAVRNDERYILSGENILIKELFEKIARFAGVPAPNIYLPDIALHMIGKAGDLITTLGKPGSLSQENAWTATLYHWFKNDKARNELGINFKPADYSIKQSVDWMRENTLI